MMFPCLVGHIVFTHCPLMDIWVVSPFSAPPFPKTVSEFQTWRAAVCRLLTQPAPWAEAVELDLGGRGRPESGRPSPGGGGAAPLQEHTAPSACTRGLWHWVASPRRPPPPARAGRGGPGVLHLGQPCLGSAQDLSAATGPLCVVRLSAWLLYLSLWLVCFSCAICPGGEDRGLPAGSQGQKGCPGFCLTRRWPHPSVPSPCQTSWPIYFAGVCPVGTVTFGRKRACVTCCPPGRGCG